jgi:metal-responsive CopG/Arc/MetJ family transcriptional regulator
LGYDLVILDVVKTAISVPDETFDRVERAAAQLGVSRSEFFARAAERWLHDLDDPQTTDAIDRALAGIVQDTAFTDAAAAAVAKREART